MVYLPQEISLALKEYFEFPEKLLFGAVGSWNGFYPSVRMMRVYDINNEGSPILLTHICSQKWSDFTAHPHASINLTSTNKLAQINVSGFLKLETPPIAKEKAELYWNNVRSDVKKIYDPQHKVGAPFLDCPEPSIPDKAPAQFGIVTLVPAMWELLLLHSDYIKSERYHFSLKESQWQKQRIHVG